MRDTPNKDSIRCVAVVQCVTATERCSGANCAMAFADRKDRFEGYGEGVLYVPFSCGGCPGRRVSRLLLHLTRAVTKRGIERSQIAVHFASCLVNDSSHYPPCPHLHYLKAVVQRKGFQLIEGSYVSRAAERRRTDANGKERADEHTEPTETGARRRR